MIFRLLFIFTLFFSPNVYSEIDSLAHLPVQDRGRVKPFDSFSKESLQLIYGRQKYKKKNANEIVLSWMLVPEMWNDIKFVEIADANLKKALRYKDLKQSHFSPKELLTNDRTSLLIKEVNLKSERKEKLNSFDQAVMRLNNQLSLFNALQRGYALHVVPDSTGENSRWFSVAELTGEDQQAFKKILSAFPQSIGTDGTSDILRSSVIIESVNEFVDLQKKKNGQYYDVDRINAEVWLHTFEPFLKASIFYLLSMLLFVFVWFSENKYLYRSAWALSLIGFVLHTVGFLVRVYIVERPPVSNMYETVVWAPWGTMIFAYVLERIYKRKTIMFAANLVAALCLVLASMAPTILDPSLQPLEAVLRSTLWLIVHVMLIVLSYGAFFLAWALGNMVLIAASMDENKHKTSIKNASLDIYRSLQIGVVLLAAGTILGGVWADYSWGRFWGWDPKETWALIALLGYLAVLHARLTGWVKEFGLAASSVAAFSLIVMAWYGVNYWLGAGLHSYGFGSGGIGYVAIAVSIQLIVVLFLIALRYMAKKS